MERLGIHRSLDPRGALPQQARRLDASSPVGPDEIAVEVEYLNVDSASWREIRESTDGSAPAMSARVLDIVRERGKMHNPVTGSGGMLVGRVAELGSHRTEPPVGSRIATLVSLTLTPLVIDEITGIDPASERVAVKGRAILFGSGLYTLVPEDLDDAVVLGVLDVCGAPAWAARLARRGMSVVVIGAGGKSGILTCAQAVRGVGGRGRVLGLCWPEDTVVTTTLFRGGRVLRLPSASYADWLVIDDAEVAGNGRDGDEPDADRIVEIDGGTLIPAFCDAHVHLPATGLYASGMDFRGERSA